MKSFQSEGFNRVPWLPAVVITFLLGVLGWSAGSSIANINSDDCVATSTTNSETGRVVSNEVCR